jgi:hypothetical protein
MVAVLSMKRNGYILTGIEGQSLEELGPGVKS